MTLLRPNRPQRRSKDRESGQSMIEFILTLSLFMAFSLFFIQAALVFAFGNYVHYATFMAARAYLSSGPSYQDQKNRAKEVLSSMVKRSSSQSGIDRFPGIAQGVGGGDPKGAEVGPLGGYYADGERHLSWAQGVRYTFRSKLFVIPLGRVSGSSGSVNGLTLVSESWLGHEPSDETCEGQLDGIYDNGC